MSGTLKVLMWREKRYVRLIQISILFAENNVDLSVNSHDNLTPLRQDATLEDKRTGKRRIEISYV